MNVDRIREHSVSGQYFTLYKEHMFEYNGGKK